MPHELPCPACKALLRLPQAPPAQALVRCPQCEIVFTPQAPAVASRPKLPAPVNNNSTDPYGPSVGIYALAPEASDRPAFHPMINWVKEEAETEDRVKRQYKPRPEPHTGGRLFLASGFAGLALLGLGLAILAWPAGSASSEPTTVASQPTATAVEPINRSAPTQRPVSQPLPDGEATADTNAESEGAKTTEPELPPGDRPPFIKRRPDSDQ